jgi:hypothetical protein
MATRVEGIDCEVCDQLVTTTGPWCDLYTQAARRPCLLMCWDQVKKADAAGDGPLVNAVCEYIRRRWGPNMVP